MVDFHFSLSHSEAELALGYPIDPDFWIEKLSRALEAIEDLRQNGTRLTFQVFLKKLCPRATARHLRMFQNWLKELSQMEEISNQLVECNAALARCQSYLSLPILPRSLREGISCDYDNLPLRDRQEQSRESFIATSCPTFRPSEGSALVNEVVIYFLKMQILRWQQDVAQKGALFATGKSVTAPMRSFLKRQVPEASWKSWEGAFDTLAEGGDTVTREQLVDSHLIPVQVCDYLCKVMGQDHGGGSFSREAFLQKLTYVSNFRPSNNPAASLRSASARAPDGRRKNGYSGYNLSDLHFTPHN